MDFDPKMIEYAVKNNNNSGTIEYFTQDIGMPFVELDDRLKQLDGKVDLIWSNRVLHWVPDKQMAVRTISRILKPGGRCYVNISLFRDLHEFFSDDEREKAEVYLKFPKLEAVFNEWKTLFDDAGFSRVDVEFLNKDYTYESTERFKKMSGNPLQPLQYFIERMEKTKAFDDLPVEKKEVLKQKYVEMMMKSSLTKFGTNPEELDFRRVATQTSVSTYYEQFRVLCIK